MPNLDQTLLAAIKGYAWLPDLRRAHEGRPADLRVLGQRAVAVCGAEATRFFYAPGNLERHSSLPAPVVNSLFGAGAVHTLDGDAHRHRKALFVHLLMDDPDHTRPAEMAAEEFAALRPPFNLFEATGAAITRAMCRWTGVPMADGFDRDLLAMVDGFATVGPRHARALAARRRQEERLAELIAGSPAGDTPLAKIAAHRDENGDLLDPRTAAVELLNVIRPAAAVAWLVTYAGHALHHWPSHRERLADDTYAAAFANEVRRFYPFTPFLGGRATQDLTFDNHKISAGTLVLLDVYGQNHDPALWPEPYAFRPERFLTAEPTPWDLIPQGGGDPRTGHRCPGEKLTMALLGRLAQALSRMEYEVPEQNMEIDLSRIPARPVSGIDVVPALVRVGA